MNFRNKDLIQIFDERYKANHNKKLYETVNNSKKNLTDRMFNGTISPDNKPIGYDAKRFRGNNHDRFI